MRGPDACGTQVPGVDPGGEEGGREGMQGRQSRMAPHTANRDPSTATRCQGTLKIDPMRELQIGNTDRFLR